MTEVTPNTKLPTPALLFATSPDAVDAVAKERLDRARSTLAGLLAADGDRTVSNTLEPYDRILLDAMEVAAQGELMFNVHPDVDVREAGDRAYQAAKSLLTELSLNRGLYEALVALDVSDEDEETKFAVFKILRDFRRSGVDRDETTRARIKELQDEINATGSEFDRNIRDDVRTIDVTPEGLDGLPEDFIAARPPGEDGRIAITTSYPDSLPVFQYAASGDVRKRLMFEFRNRGHPVNLAVLDRLLAKRHDLAKILGYPHFADYVTEDKMIESGKAAGAFVDKVTAAADARAREDRTLLLERKKQDDPEATTLDPWDRLYYEERVRAERFAYDSREVRPFLPFPRVRDGLFTITGKLFGVRYERVEDAPVWHPSVEAYDVYDGDSQLGRFYLDLFPRDGKYTHAAAFYVALGLSGVQLPQASLVCNFPDPAKGPGLMTHADVVTFFHEFGHLLHMIFSGGVRWVKSTMEAIEWDFVEAPSQMLEEWTRDVESLRSFARHHETGEPIPTDLVERMRRSDAVGRGLGVRRQMFLAAFSLSCYDRNPSGLDTTVLAKSVHEKYEMVPWFEGTHLQCGFGHLNGYSAIYYTYMWSLVIAKDLFRAFEEQGAILNPTQAAKYRRAILNTGSARSAADMVRAYLDRDPTFDAFQAWLEETAG